MQLLFSSHAVASHSEHMRRVAARLKPRDIILNLGVFSQTKLIEVTHRSSRCPVSVFDLGRCFGSEAFLTQQRHRASRCACRFACSTTTAEGIRAEARLADASQRMQPRMQPTMSIAFLAPAGARLNAVQTMSEDGRYGERAMLSASNALVRWARQQLQDHRVAVAHGRGHEVIVHWPSKPKGREYLLFDVAVHTRRSRTKVVDHYVWRRIPRRLFQDACRA